MPAKPDVRVTGRGGSVVMIEPISRAAKAWVKENVPLESWQWFGRAFACEARYVTNLIDGMREEGLHVAA